MVGRLRTQLTSTLGSRQGTIAWLNYGQAQRPKQGINTGHLLAQLPNPQKTPDTCQGSKSCPPLKKEGRGVYTWGLRHKAFLSTHWHQLSPGGAVGVDVVRWILIWTHLPKSSKHAGDIYIVLDTQTRPKWFPRREVVHWAGRQVLPRERGCEVWLPTQLGTLGVIKGFWAEAAKADTPTCVCIFRPDSAVNPASSLMGRLRQTCPHSMQAQPWPWGLGVSVGVGGGDRGEAGQGALPPVSGRWSRLPAAPIPKGVSPPEAGDWGTCQCEGHLQRRVQDHPSCRCPG